MSNTVASSSTTVFVGGGTPMEVGTTASTTVGFYGATPVIQQTKPVAVVTTAPTLSAYGFTYAQAASIITAINTAITAITTLGLWA